jgi:hypothetical protein
MGFEENAEGFLKAKGMMRAEMEEYKKEEDLRKLSMMVSKDYFLQIQEERELEKLSEKEIEDSIIQNITNYFNKCFAINTIPTTNGLASVLNLSRKKLREMSNENTRIGVAIRKAFQAMSAFAEERLLEGKASQGIIFWLKNNDDWVDAHEVKHNNKTMGEIIDEMKSKGELIDGNDNAIISDINDITENVYEEEQ